jgi:hypothetical protein
VEGKKRDWLDYATGVLELIGLVVLIAYTTFAALQWCEMKRSVGQAQDALKTAREQFAKDERPYIWLANDSAGPFTVAALPGPLHDHLALNYRYTNYGKTPAVNVVAVARLYFVADPGKIVLDDTQSLPSVGPILPTGKVDYSTAFSDAPIDAKTYKALGTRGAIVFVVIAGVIRYSGMDGTAYTTEFCLERNPERGFAYCPVHNAIH